MVQDQSHSLSTKIFISLIYAFSSFPIAIRNMKRFYDISKIVYKRKNVKWFVMPFVGLYVGGHVYMEGTTQKLSIEQVKSTVTGVYRLSNLVSTVIVIAGDYVATKYMCRNDDREADLVRSELKRARADHEKISIRRYMSKEESVDNDLKEELQASINRMKSLSNKLLKLEDVNQGTGSAYRKVNLRSAERLHRLCEKNGGVYIKLGQHLAQLDYLLPAEFTEVLRRLLGDTPRSPYDSVRR